MLLPQNPLSVRGRCFLLVLTIGCSIGLGSLVAAAQTDKPLDPARARALRSTRIEGKEATPLAARTDDAFQAIALAWAREDHTELSRLVAREGVRIAIAPDPERDNHYSPNQAYYFFKNLFKSSSTETFHFSRQQEGSKGQNVHAVADWGYCRISSEEPVVDRLMFTLTREETGWGLAEIRAIR